MKTVLVGIDPGNNSGPSLDPDFPSGARLARLAGLSPADFRGRFDRINLYPTQPPWSSRETDRRAGENLASILRGRRAIALGGRVAIALGLENPVMEWTIKGGFVGSVLPHPSGLSRWWNYPENVEAAEKFMRNLLLPCVHVEGTDGSGKSTLVPHLAERLGCRAMPTEDRPGSWEECVDRILLRIPPGIVCDRSSGLVSELVYGPVLRGGTIKDESLYWGLLQSMIHAVAFVYCRPPIGEIDPTFRLGEDPAHVEAVKRRSVDLVDRYDLVMCRISQLGGRVVRYDRTNQLAQEIVRCVE